MLLEHRPDSASQPSHLVESSFSHAYISANIDESEFIGTTSISRIDYLGLEHSRYFRTAQGYFGFSGENYSRIEKILNDISQKRELRNTVSYTFIKDTFFAWVEGKYKNEMPESYEFLNYLKEKCVQEIKNRKISIPIDFLNIQSSFKIGNVEFEYYRRDLFDAIEHDIRENTRESDQDIEFGIRRIRQQFQGKTYASINIYAETQKCIEIAKEVIDKSLTILLFFAKHALHQEIPSYVGRMGSVNVPLSYLFIFEDDIPRISKGIEEKKDMYLTIDEEYMQRIESGILEKFNELLIKENLNSFEYLLLNCIDLYVRGMRSRDFQDKLVFTLVSIETLLLRDNQEPIQASVGLRLAFLYGESITERKEAIQIIKDAYVYRSKYIHHGNREEEDYELLQKLQIAVWTGVCSAVIMKDQFNSQKDLMDYIQDKILS
jgi:hypothetical protein